MPHTRTRNANQDAKNKDATAKHSRYHMKKTKPGFVGKIPRFDRARVSQICRVQEHDFYVPPARCHNCWTVLYRSGTRQKSFGSFFRAIGMAACPLLTGRRDQKSDSQKITGTSSLITPAYHRLRLCVGRG